MELKSGIYESLIYEALKRKLETLSDKFVFTDSIDSGEAPKLLTNYVAKIINSLLSDDSLFETLEGRFKFVNDILNYIDKNWQCDIDDSLLTNQEELLSGIVDMAGLTNEQAKQRVTPSSVLPCVRFLAIRSATSLQVAIPISRLMARLSAIYSRPTRYIG